MVWKKISGEASLGQIPGLASLQELGKRATYQGFGVRVFILDMKDIQFLVNWILTQGYAEL